MLFRSMVQLDQFAVGCWVQMSSTPAAGILEIALVDGSGSIVGDNVGTPNVFTQSLPAIGGVWTFISGVFRSPRVLPSNVRLRVRLSTALSVGKTVHIDRLGFAEPVPLYQQGPYFACFSGNEILINGDGYSTVVANNYAGQFQQLFDKYFNMKGLGYLLPSSTSPTISDSLIG